MVAPTQGQQPQPQPGAVPPGVVANDDPEAAAYAAMEEELAEPDPLLGDGGEGSEGDDPGDGGEPAAREPAGESDGTNEEDLTPQHRANLQAALRQSREESAQLRRQLGGFLAFQERLEEQREARARQSQEPKQPEKKEPTVEDDPIGFFQNELAKRDKLIDELRTQTTERTQRTQAQLEEQQFWGEVQRSETAIRARVTDYDQACEHLETARVAELEIMFPDDSPRAQALAQHYGLQSPAHLRAATLNQDRIAVARQAMQLGIPPAELYYKLAIQRGFQAAQQQQAGLLKSKGQEPLKGAKAQVAAARRGQASRTISGGGGRSENGPSIDRLVELYAEDGDAFDKEWDRAKRAGLLG